MRNRTVRLTCPGCGIQTLCAPDLIEDSDMTCDACGERLEVDVTRFTHGDDPDRADLENELAEVKLFSD